MGRARTHRDLLGGQYDSYVITSARRPTRGVQVELTPQGAATLLDVPLDRLANTTEDFGDVAGHWADRLSARLGAVDSWGARFALLDAALRARADRSPRQGVSPEVAWTLEVVRARAGSVRVDALAAELGGSRQRLHARFAAEVGLPPKRLARLVRFDQLLDRVAGVVVRCGGVPASGWMGIAMAAGYHDQSHLIREFREFAGTTPGGYLRRRFQVRTSDPA